MITPRILHLDVTEIERKETRTRFRQWVDETGVAWESSCQFWDRFLQPGAATVPPNFLVVGDLARIAGHYRAQGTHRWRTAVRRAQPIFLVLVPKPRDEGATELIDDLIRDSDLRLIVCGDTEDEGAARLCLSRALTALEPDSILEVRYSRPRDLLWLHFSDGFSAFVQWHDLGIEDLRSQIVAESAATGEWGRTLELSTGTGDLLEIDAAAIRATVDHRFAGKLSAETTRSDQAVGAALRGARRAAGLTQAELGGRADIDQAVISRLERGKHRPRIDTLRRIANALGFSVSQLLAGGHE